MRDIDPDPLPEGTGDRVCGVYPAVRVEHILRNVFGVNTVYGVAHVLSRGHDQREGKQAHHREGVVQAEDGRVDVDMADLDKVLESAEDVQHLGGSCMAWTVEGVVVLLWRRRGQMNTGRGRASDDCGTWFCSVL